MLAKNFFLIKDESERLEQIGDAHLQSSYVQLLSMMKYDIGRYSNDGTLCVREVRRRIWSILFNCFHGYRFKIRVVFICVAVDCLYLIKIIKAWWCKDD